MIQNFLWETYLAHSSLFDNIALIIIGITLFFGIYFAVKVLDRELTNQ